MRTANWEGFDQVSIEFLTSQKKQTQLTYKSLFKLVLRYTGMTGQEILDSKKTDKDFEWERKVIAFKQWVKTQKNNRGEFYGDSAAATAVNALRSFFDYYRTPFVFNQGENRKLNGKVQRKTKDYMLTNEDIAKMVLVADLREKYIVLNGKSVGLRVGDFTTFTYGTFRSLNLITEAPVFMGEMITQKEGVLAYPFIDSDALPIVKSLLDCNQDKADSERIIAVQDEELTTILQALAVKANINLGGKHLRFHCFRKYLIDRLSACMSESKWKQIIGKSISEDAYVSSFELRECYIKTMKLTTISTNGNGKVTKLSEEIDTLTETMEQLKQEYDAKFKEQEKQMINVLELLQSVTDLKPSFKKQLSRSREELKKRTLIETKEEQTEE